MKVEFRFDSDKMRALKMYTEQKGVSLEEELIQAADAQKIWRRSNKI